MIKRKKPKFVRKETFKKLRFGKVRKKKRKWRRALGNQSKVRKKRKGYRKKPSIGYRQARSIRGLVSNLKPRIIYNSRELNDLKKNEIAVIGKVGKKKRIEMVKKASEKKIKILNLNVKKFLKKIEKEREEKAKEKKKKEEKEKKIEEKKKKELEKEEKGKEAKKEEKKTEEIKEKEQKIEKKTEETKEEVKKEEEKEPVKEAIKK